MEPPRGFWASLWNFIRFLPFFIGLLILGFTKDLGSGGLNFVQDMMKTIFGNDAATGDRAVSGFDHFSLMNVTDESVNEDMENVEMDPSPVHGRKHTAEEGTNKAKRRRALPVDESIIALSRIADSSTKIAQAKEMQATQDTLNHVN